MTHCNTTTKLLMAAAHLYPSDFEDDIEERAEHPYKATAPELSIDVNKIKCELIKSKARYFNKSIFLFLLFFVTISYFILFNYHDKNNDVIIFSILFIGFLTEFLYLRSVYNEVRIIMGTEDDSEVGLIDLSSLKAVSVYKQSYYRIMEQFQL